MKRKQRPLRINLDEPLETVKVTKSSINSVVGSHQSLPPGLNFNSDKKWSPKIDFNLDETDSNVNKNGSSNLLNLIDYSDSSNDSDRNKKIETFKNFADFDNIKIETFKNAEKSSNIKTTSNIKNEKSNFPPGINVTIDNNKKQILENEKIDNNKIADNENDDKNTKKWREIDRTKEKILRLCIKLKQNVRKLIKRDPKKFKNGIETSLFFALFENRRRDWRIREISSKYFLRRLEEMDDEFERIRKKFDKNEIDFKRILKDGKCLFEPLFENEKNGNVVRWLDKSCFVVDVTDLSKRKKSKLVKMFENAEKKNVIAENDLVAFIFENEEKCAKALEKIDLPPERFLSENLGINWEKTKDFSFRFLNYSDKID